MYKNRTNPKILCLNYHVKPNLPVLEFLQYMTIRSTKTGPTGNFYGLIGMSIQIHLHRFFSIGPTVTKIQTNVLTKSQQQLSLVIELAKINLRNQNSVFWKNDTNITSIEKPTLVVRLSNLRYCTNCNNTYHKWCETHLSNIE